MSSANDDFYVGYLDDTPPALASFTRGRVLLILLVVLLAAPMLALSQNPFSRAAFEFGTTRKVTGLVQLEPYPVLLVPRPGEIAAGEGAYSRYLLVAFGKFGADELMAEYDGKWATVEGTLVYRRAETMVEVVGVEAAEAASQAPVAATEDLGEHVYVGEIVDSKCFLGVMKPGNTKPHRACATRCISGGIPPVLLVRDGEGHAAYFLLTDAAGEAVNARVLDMVAEPIRVTGRVVRQGDQLVLQSDPSTYERL